MNALPVTLSDRAARRIAEIIKAEPQPTALRLRTQLIGRLRYLHGLGLAQLDAIPNDELRWRLASVAAVAARRQGDARTGEAMAGTAHDAFERLRSAWKEDFRSYESRPDLADLRNLTARN